MKKGLKFFGVLNVSPQRLEKKRLNDLEMNDILVAAGNNPKTLFRFQPR